MTRSCWRCSSGGGNRRWNDSCGTCWFRLKCRREIVATPRRHTFDKFLVFDLVTQPRQFLAPGSAPTKIVELLAERHVHSQRGQSPIQIRLIPMLAKAGCQRRSAPDTDSPFRLAIRDRFDVPVERQQRRSGLTSPARYARITVGSIADERQPVRN